MTDLMMRKETSLDDDPELLRALAKARLKEADKLDDPGAKVRNKKVAGELRREATAMERRADRLEQKSKQVSDPARVWKKLTEKRRILLVDLHDGRGLERVYGAARIRHLHVLQGLKLIDLGPREERIEVTELGHAVAELSLRGGYEPTQRVPNYAGALAEIRDALAGWPKDKDVRRLIAIADAELSLPDPLRDATSSRAEQVEHKAKAAAEPAVMWRRLIGNTKGARRLDYYYMLNWCLQPKGFYPKAGKHRIMLNRLAKHGLVHVSGYAKLSETGVALLHYLNEARKTEAGCREVRLGKSV